MGGFIPDLEVTLFLFCAILGDKSHKIATIVIAMRKI